MASGQQGYDSVDPQAAVLEWRSCVPPAPVAHQRQLLPSFDHDRDVPPSSTFSSFNHSSSSSFSLGSTPSQPQLYGHPVESPVPQAVTEAQYEQSPPAPWTSQRAPFEDTRNPQPQQYHSYDGNNYTHASLRSSQPISPVHLGLQLRYPPQPSQGYVEPLAPEAQPLNGGMDPSPEPSPVGYYAPPIPPMQYPRSGIANIMPYPTHPQFHLNGHPIAPRPPSHVNYQYHNQVMPQGTSGGDDSYVHRHEKRQYRQSKPYGPPPPPPPVRRHMDDDEDDSDDDYDPLPIPKAVTHQQRLMQSLVDPDGKVRPHQCGECKKRFVRVEHLKRHVKAVHRGIKDFACFLCGKRCSRLDNLRQHLKLHGPRDKTPPEGNDKEQDEDEEGPSTSKTAKRAPSVGGNQDA